MNGHWGIYRLTNQRREIAKERALYSNAAALAINILREPLPDTFLGRQHYERTPLPHELELAPAVPAATRGADVRFAFLEELIAEVTAAHPGLTRDEACEKLLEAASHLTNG